MASNRGSEWCRWDVHIHTPGTALADEYPVDSWDEYISRINNAVPAVVALGVTDYLSIRGYRILRERWLAGGLPGVRLIFPNIEFRVSPPTQHHKGVNFHILVDPSDPDHIDKIESALSRLTFTYGGEVFNCNHSGLMRLGKALNPGQHDDEAAYREGVNAFKLDFSALRSWLREDAWLQDHCLIAVANKEGDGVSGLPREHGYAATMDEMYRLAQIILSGNPADRRYWLGEGTDGIDQMIRRYNGIKPCLHGCDAHHLERVLTPDSQRLCWIRAEPTFEGLRQVVFEPKDRVYIGPDRPSRARQNWIRSIAVDTQENWFATEPVELNEGLVAIIGPRGSGKTACADLIAHGADAFDSGPASFLGKAMPLAIGAKINLTWADRDEPAVRVVGEAPDDFSYPSVRYLSQHFVEQLCSPAGASDRLIEEVEHVVFEALDETDRAEASSFSELRKTVTEASTQRIQDLRGQIADCSEEISREQAGKADLPAKRERLKAMDAELSGIAKTLGGLIIKGKEEKTKLLQGLRDETTKLETVITGLKLTKRRIEEIKRDLEQQSRLNAESHSTLRRELKGLGIVEADLDSFKMRFAGDVNAILDKRQEAVAKDIARYSEGPKAPPDFSATLAVLRGKVEAVVKEIGLDTAKERQIAELQRKQRIKTQERGKIEAEIKRAESADTIIKQSQKRRLDRYVEMFAELARQREELDRLYRPLGSMLSAAPEERRKLEFFVRQLVDVEAWATRGEQLLDHRRRGEHFREPDSLARKAEELLGEAWRSGDPERIRGGMEAFLERFRDARNLLAPSVTLSQLAEWLFSTDHVRVTYGIRYEGTDIELLSPGTRGIVLLILYLALDTQDDRPLIIDQPEENLDPESVYDVLTGYFRDIRGRRQVIVVTHNPNLVVNTDVDQVIVASAKRVGNDALPHFNYETGGLENPKIRKRVCQILEGGERAFLDRERRYRLQAG